MMQSSKLTTLDDVDKGPVFTPQDEKDELATLTISDMIKVQADLTGITAGVSCLSLSAATCANDPASIPTVIARLNEEMSRLPAAETNAYYHAVEMCPRLVNHERKLIFLECENGDVLLAAKKMARYWETRLLVFGPDRCFLPMTLAGAMQGEAINMINRRIWHLLPVTDSAGRAIMFFSFGRRNFAEYSVRQELMAMWYLLETVMEDENLRRRGYVGLGDSQGMQRRHISRQFEALIGAVLECLPITPRGAHFCHPSKLFFYVLFPVIKYIMPKRIRIRLKLHYGSTDQVLVSLASYCLPRDRVPSELGGSLVLDMNQWIQNRLELENARESESNSMALAAASSSVGAVITTAAEPVNNASATLAAKTLRSDEDAHHNSSASDAAASASAAAPITKKKESERKGRGEGGGRGIQSDPRMTKAIELKEADSAMSLYDALVAGGFVFRQNSITNDMIDADGIMLTQRKNNLCRRIRLRKKKRKAEEETSQALPRQSPRGSADCTAEAKQDEAAGTGTCDINRPSTSSSGAYDVSGNSRRTEAGVAEALLGLSDVHVGKKPNV